MGARREPLGKRALNIISVLAEAKGEIVTKDELLEAVWPGVIVEENALQVHVVALRKALGPEADRLRTIRGVGYQLHVDPDPATSAAADETAAPSQLEPTTNIVSQPAAELRQSTRIAGALRSWGGAHRWAFLAAGVLAMLVGAWAIFGSELGLRSSERIPVVVRGLTASGTGEQAEAALASGITDELIFRLRRIPELRIATAAPDGTVPGGAFNNAYVIDGTIHSSGDRLRVAVRLADAKGEILWSDTLDRGVSDLFDMQEDIAAAIAGALSVSFEVGANAPQYGGTDNPEAYVAYMQYWEHALDFDQAVPQRHLERAVALDPDFGKAIGGLALVYGNRIVAAGTKEQAEQLLAEMDAASARALAANPDLWFGQAARGWYFLSRRDFATAEKQMRRVAEFDPHDDPELRLHLLTYATHLGRLREAMSIRESRELIDPIYQRDPWKIFDLMMTGRYEDSIALFERLSRDEDRNVQAFAFSAYLSYLLAGREDEAEKFAEAYPFAGQLREIRANKTLPAMSRQQLRSWANAHYQGIQVAVSGAAIIAGYEGHDRLAVDLLRIAYERPGGFVLLMIWHPALASARKTDEFEQFITDLGMVKAWRESGDWGDYCRPVSQTEISCT